MQEFEYKHTLIGMLGCLLVMTCIFFNMHIMAFADTDEYAYLTFYTIDGEEIESLGKKVRTSKEYTFKNPDEYKYLPYEDENGNEVYNEFNDQVTGIYWEEEFDDGRTGQQYEDGESATFSAGEHYFRVKSDNPTLTGENLLNLSYSEKAHLVFMTPNEEEIEELQTELAPKDEYTFQNPNDYLTLPDSEEEVEGVGTYWLVKNENGKKYLFKEGDRVKFQAGEYTAKVLTDTPVTVTFSYPMDVDTYFVNDVDKTGSTYATVTAKPGDKILLKKSLGSIVWEASFAGWEEYNDDYMDGENHFDGGETFQIMDNKDLNFVAIYEYDPNWDPYAVDQNTGLKPDEEKQENIADITSAKENAGAGYDAYLDSSGKLKRKGGNTQINSAVNLKGIPGTIKTDPALSSLKTGGDPKNPEDYEKDIYGKSFDAESEEDRSKLPREMNNVLKQDDSAMYMDVYGNAFVYLPGLERVPNMELAYERLTEGKTDSWVNNVSNWDKEMINRFEAIEFALLKGTYPEDGEDLFKDFNFEKYPELLNTDGSKPTMIWKDEYMSETAFKQIENYKTIWSGWYDNYTDGLYEKYKADQGDGGVIVGSLLNQTNNLFGTITAYAEEKNDVGEAMQVGGRLNKSLDINDFLFKPQYFDKNKLYSFSSFSFLGLEGLSAEQLSVLNKLYDAFLKAGWSKEAAAGVCGNIWQESTFDPKAGASKSAKGLVQWMDGRLTNLQKFAASKGTTWDDVDVQIEFIFQELNSSLYRDLNQYLKYTPFAGSDIKQVTDVETVAAAWCAMVERCVCGPNGGVYPGHAPAHNSLCAVAANGRSYQHLNQRIQYAEKIFQAMQWGGASGSLGGNWVGMSNAQIISSIFPGVSAVSTLPDHGMTQSRMEREYIVTVPAPGKGTLRVNKFIAEDVTQIFTELNAMGFPIKSSTTSGYVWRNIGGKNKMSFHATGLAIDLNWDANPDVRVSGTDNQAAVISKVQAAGYSPKTNPYAIKVAQANVFKKYGMLWGRDFTSYLDMMHFSLGEVSHDGRYAYVSNALE